MDESLIETLGACAAAALAAATPQGKLDALAPVLAAVSPAPTCTHSDEEFAARFCRPAPRTPYARLQLVAPDQVPQRKPTTVAGRAALLHAIAHIEYSAIDLALDHALRFRGMPTQYYFDWLRVACDEARHFGLLRAHLQTLGHDYGDFPVHDGLWQMAERTADDVLARMAMVPRLLEARGLDATPPIQRKLADVGDAAAVAVLEVILRDEEDHVRLGDHWFRHLCAEREVPPEPTFRAMIERYRGPWPQTPMNRAARLAAGFSAAELDDLTTNRPAR